MAHTTTPEEFLGFRVGEDRKLAGWPEIVDYLRLLERNTDRIIVDEIGHSTEDNPFLACTISSAENLSNIERFHDIQQALSDPRDLSGEDAEKLISEARSVVAITCSIHATEVGASQMALELAHLLTTSDEPRIRTILDNTILILVPSLNPDGLVRVKGWYDASVGTHFEGSIPPYLYHKYTGHDNNRDWFMFTQQETRLVVEHVHNKWRPHITYDIHQTRSDGMRMILPPLVDPIGPNVDPVLQSELSVLGTHMAAQLTAEGKAGVAVNVVYDSYSPSRSYPHYHGGIRVLSEAASARIATPIKIEKRSLRDDRGELPRKRSWNHPMPWSGGSWRLRDIVNYDLSASLACLDHAARNREWWVKNSFEVLERAVSDQGNPYAFVIPEDQHDESAARELTELLSFAEVEIHESDESFDHEDIQIGIGDKIVLTKQPFGSFAHTMLERQRYPDIRQYPGGPPKAPYDATAHSLPLKMGVECREIKKPFAASLRRISSPLGQPSGGQQPLKSEAPAYAVSPTSNASAKVVNQMLFDARPVFRLMKPLDGPDGSIQAGTWVIPASDVAREALADNTATVDVRSLWERPEDGLKLVRPPRIGIYSSYVPCIEEGWTRFVFDEYGFRYVSLVDGDIREGGLSSRFDCIVVPHQQVRQLHRGFSSTHYSPRFSGGLGDRGLERLKEFVERGGTVIAWDDSARLLVRRMHLPVTNPLAKLTNSEFFAPGSLLKIDVDNDHPIGFGMPKTAAALFMNGPAYKVEQGSVVASFAEDETLMSGWLIGQQKIAGLAALTSIPLGLGQVILFGFRPHFRAQARGTYKLLFNSIYHSVR